MNNYRLVISAASIVVALSMADCLCEETKAVEDSDKSVVIISSDNNNNNVITATDGHSSKLTEKDYLEVAEELGVEVAAIKAIVDIEAGRAHEGFFQPGKPIINFDLKMYHKFAKKHGVSISAAKKKAPVIFAHPNISHYGSYQAAQYARLDAARNINETSALESAFWGMFQIGGFNWKICDCDSVGQFVEIMSQSERAQLELFARLIKKCGMLEYLQKKQWLKFALRYNGPKAKARKYHTRIAAAYARHKAAEQQNDDK